MGGKTVGQGWQDVDEWCATKWPGFDEGVCEGVLAGDGSGHRANVRDPNSGNGV